MVDNTVVEAGAGAEVEVGTLIPVLAEMLAVDDSCVECGAWPKQTWAASTPRPTTALIRCLNSILPVVISAAKRLRLCSLFGSALVRTETPYYASSVDRKRAGERPRA